MSKRIKTLVMIALLPIIALAGYAIYILSIAGEFKTLEPHFDGSCRVVEGTPGPEDMAMLADGSGVFISSDDRLGVKSDGTPRGAIYFYDFKNPPVKVSPDFENFRPHGIGLWEGDKTSLFVVSHPGGDLHGDLATDGPAHTVEIFDFAGSKLIHRRTVAAEELVTPNDVEPVGPDSFYVTNDHGTGDKFWRKVEDYARLSRAHVLFFDGSEFTKLPKTYRYANGIAASRDGSQIYVAATTDRSVYIFDRDTKTNQLTFKKEIFADSGVDNIFVDATGDLWIGSHPKLLTMARFMKQEVPISPTQVLRLVKANGFAPEEVLLSDGSDVSASTVAVHHEGRILVGGIFSNGILDCDMAIKTAR